jgi:hypothetical protein
MFKDLRNKRKQDNLNKGGPDEPDFQATIDQEKQKYEEILSRIDGIKAKTYDEGGDINVAIQGANGIGRINTSSRADQELARPVSKRYST